METTVENIHVQWHDGAANDPTLFLLVRGLPEHRNGPYQKVPVDASVPLSAQQMAVVGSAAFRPVRNEHVYWQEWDSDGDFAWFFTWTGVPDDGFGGWKRTIELTDGGTENVVGGWHTMPAVAEAAGFPATLDTGVVRAEDVDNGGARWPSGGLATFVTVSRISRELERLCPDLELIEAPYVGHTVKWRGRASKAEWLELDAVRHKLVVKELAEKYGLHQWYKRATRDERDRLQPPIKYGDLGPA
jgi:hypothetical protein